jgi:NitT/TauT family transport system substrate-binding protein
VSGRLNRQIRVGINTWCGFAGGPYFNNGFKPSQESKFYKDYGVMVEFVVIDDFNAGKEAWKADKIDFWYCTVDSFPVDAAGIAALNPKILFQSDWSRGGDAIVVRPGINSVAELKGKTIAVATGSPSHTFLLWMLSAGDINSSDVKLKQSSSGIESAQYFKAGKVDAAVVWSPDDGDCVTAVLGSKVLVSTKQATHIIADALYAKKSFIDKYQKETKAIVEGWLKGNAVLNGSQDARDRATKILSAGFNVPEDFASSGIVNARLCTYGDNINFFGMNRNYTGMNGQSLYERMCIVWNKIGLAGENNPSWRSIVDTSIIQSLNLSDPAEGGMTFEKVSESVGESMDAMSTKRITISFASGSSTLDANAKYIIQIQFGDLAKSFAGARVRIEGNTDNIGDADMNMLLSKRRAQSVADYLVSSYRFNPNRFIIVGNGLSKPIADNGTEDGRSKNRRTDFELIK